MKPKLTHAVDGFYWTRITARQLKFIYEGVTVDPLPPGMRDLAAAVDRLLAPRPQPDRDSDDEGDG